MEIPGTEGLSSGVKVHLETLPIAFKEMGCQMNRYASSPRALGLNEG